MKDVPLTLFDPQHPLAHIGKKIFVAVAVLLAVIIYYITRYAKGAEVVATLSQASFGMLILMLLAKSFYLIFQGGLMRSIYQAVGFRRNLLYATSIYISMNLVNTIAPVMGLSGSIYMMHFEKGRGLNRSDTFLINFLYYLTDYIVFLFVLIIGLVYLLLLGEITRTILLFSLIFSGFVAALAVIGIIAFTHPTALYSLTHWINRVVSRLLLKKKPLVSDAAVGRFAEGAQVAWVRSRKSGRELVKAAGFAFCLHLACLTLLWLSFKTFGVRTDIQVLVAGYTVATLLSIVSITPAGIGFAEGGMTAVFAALGVPVEQALVVALIYRAFFVWYPLALGVITLQLLPTLASQVSEGDV